MTLQTADGTAGRFWTPAITAKRVRGRAVEFSISVIGSSSGDSSEIQQLQITNGGVGTFRLLAPGQATSISEPIECPPSALDIELALIPLYGEGVTEVEETTEEGSDVLQFGIAFTGGAAEDNYPQLIVENIDVLGPDPTVTGTTITNGVLNTTGEHQLLTIHNPGNGCTLAITLGAETTTPIDIDLNDLSGITGDIGNALVALTAIGANMVQEVSVNAASYIDLDTAEPNPYLLAFDIIFFPAQGPVADMGGSCTDADPLVGILEVDTLSQGGGSLDYEVVDSRGRDTAPESCDFRVTDVVESGSVGGGELARVLIPAGEMPHYRMLVRMSEGSPTVEYVATVKIA